MAAGRWLLGYAVVAWGMVLIPTVAGAQPIRCDGGRSCPIPLLCMADGSCKQACGPGVPCPSGCCQFVPGTGYLCVDQSACGGRSCVAGQCANGGPCVDLGFGKTCLTPCRSNAQCGNGCCVPVGGTYACLSDPYVCACRTPAGDLRCDAGQLCARALVSEGPPETEEAEADGDGEIDGDANEADGMDTDTDETAGASEEEEEDYEWEFEETAYTCRAQCRKGADCASGCCLVSPDASGGVCGLSGEPCGYSITIPPQKGFSCDTGLAPAWGLLGLLLLGALWRILGIWRESPPSFRPLRE